MLLFLLISFEEKKRKMDVFLSERQSNSHILMGKKRHFSSANTKQVKKIEPKQHDKAKQLQKVLKKITKKATDEVKQAAVHVKQQKKNDKPALKPKVVEKPLIKAKEIQSDDISDKNDDDDDDDDNDDKSDDDDDANVSESNLLNYSRTSANGHLP